jgi:hypothetical protein
VRTGFKADLVVLDERRVRPAMPTVETCGAAPVRDITPRV